MSTAASNQTGNLVRELRPEQSVTVHTSDGPIVVTLRKFQEGENPRAKVLLQAPKSVKIT